MLKPIDLVGRYPLKFLHLRVDVAEEAIQFSPTKEGFNEAPKLEPSVAARNLRLPGGNHNQPL